MKTIQIMGKKKFVNHISDEGLISKIYKEFFPLSRGSAQPRDQTWVSCIASRLFTIRATREAQSVLSCAFDAEFIDSQDGSSLNILLVILHLIS